MAKVTVQWTEGIQESINREITNLENFWNSEVASVNEDFTSRIETLSEDVLNALALHETSNIADFHLLHDNLQYHKSNELLQYSTLVLRTQKYLEEFTVTSTNLGGYQGGLLSGHVNKRDPHSVYIIAEGVDSEIGKLIPPLVSGLIPEGYLPGDIFCISDKTSINYYSNLIQAPTEQERLFLLKTGDNGYRGYCWSGSYGVMSVQVPVDSTLSNTSVSPVQTNAVVTYSNTLQGSSDNLTALANCSPSTGYLYTDKGALSVKQFFAGDGISLVYPAGHTGSTTLSVNYGNDNLSSSVDWTPSTPGSSPLPARADHIHGLANHSVSWNPVWSVNVRNTRLGADYSTWLENLQSTVYTTQQISVAASQAGSYGGAVAAAAAAEWKAHELSTISSDDTLAEGFAAGQLQINKVKSFNSETAKYITDYEFYNSGSKTPYDSLKTQITKTFETDRVLATDDDGEFTATSVTVEELYYLVSRTPTNINSLSYRYLDCVKPIIYKGFPYASSDISYKNFNFNKYTTFYRSSLEAPAYSDLNFNNLFALTIGQVYTIVISNARCVCMRAQESFTYDFPKFAGRYRERAISIGPGTYVMGLRSDYPKFDLGPGTLTISRTMYDHFMVSYICDVNH